MTSRIALLLGAIGAVGLTLYAGRNNPSVVLPAVFALWVMSPFALIGLAMILSKRLRPALNVLSILVAVCTLGIYAIAALVPAHRQAAFPFVVTPPVSWLLTGAVALIAGRISRRSGPTER